MGEERIKGDRCLREQGILCRLLALQALVEEMQRAVQGAGGLCRRSGPAGQTAMIAQVVAEAALLEGFEGSIGQLHTLPSPLTFGVPQAWAAGWRALPARTKPADEPARDRRLLPHTLRR